jgi:HEAT repeat protein
LLFLHRSFQEYLTSQALAERVDWLDVAMQHAYDPEWLEVLGLLGAMLKDRAKAYVAALLRKNKEDLLCRPLQLGVSAAAECGDRDLPPGLTQGLIALVVELLVVELDEEPHLFTRERLQSMVTCWGARALPDLISLLEHENPRVQEAAAQALGAIASPEAVEALIFELENTGGYSVEALIWELKNTGGYGVRWRVAEALGAIGSLEAVAPLIRQLEKEEDPSVRWRVAEALGAIGSLEAVAPLIRQLEKEGTHFWGLDALEGSSPLGTLGSAEAVAPLTRWLDSENFIMRWTVAKALGVIGSLEAVAPLTRWLESKNYHIRWQAAELLGTIGSAEAVAPLIRRLETEEESYVRSKVAEALGTIGSSEAVAPLIRRLEKEEQPIVREAAAKALGAIGSAVALTPLMRLEIGERGDVFRARAEAVSAIGMGRRAPVTWEEAAWQHLTLDESLNRVAQDCDPVILMEPRSSWFSRTGFKKFLQHWSQ